MKSIRLRFVIITLAGLTAALALAFWFFVAIFNANFQARLDSELTGHLNRLAASIEFTANGELHIQEIPSDNRFFVPYSGLYWQIDEIGHDTQLRSESLFDFALPVPADEHDAGDIHRYRLPGPDNTEVIVQERRIIVSAPGGVRNLRIAVAQDAAALDTATNDFAMAILPYIAALAVILALFSGVQLSFGFRPLVKLTRELKELKEKRTERLSDNYPTELRPLVNEVNSLLDSQKEAMDRARARAADLAHGLKTPLTVLSGNALQLAERGDAEMAAELEHLSETMLTHVNHELVRSRLAPTPAQRTSDAELYAIITPLIRTLKHTPKGEALEWTQSIQKDLMLPVDPHDLRELMGNILENACKWAKHRVAISATRLGGQVLVVTRDDGPGAPPEKISTMTKRGVRLDHKTPGTGLGLSIVREITENYGIELIIDNHDDGGLRVTLAFNV